MADFGNTYVQQNPERKKWTFPIPLFRMTSLVEEKMAWHKSKLTYWQAQLDKANTETVDDVEEDDEYLKKRLERRISVCKGKISTHEAGIEDAKLWIALFKTTDSQEMTVPMTYDDAVYFGLRKSYYSKETSDGIA